MIAKGSCAHGCEPMSILEGGLFLAVACCVGVGVAGRAGSCRLQRHNGPALLFFVQERYTSVILILLSTWKLQNPPHKLS